MLSSLSLAAPTLAWRQADDALFVATRDGEYAGYVSEGSRGFEARNGRGRDLGTHRRATEAAAALAETFAQVA